MPHADQLQFGEDPALLALRMAWDRTLNALSSRVNKPLFESCLKTVVPLEYNGDTVVLGASGQFAKHWIENKYLTAIRDIMGSHLGKTIKVLVRVHRADSAEVPEPGCRETIGAPSTEAAGHARESAPALLNDNYTFDTFVVGPSNRLAYAASCAVAKSPGASYNPLFVYGGPGLGKTHLLHAIGNFVRTYLPDVGMTYTSAETFTCDYVAAVTDRKTAQFRRRYRSVDLWLVDDVQFLAGKERTKEEFFHTFNALHEVGKQIVLTSDRAPKDLELDVRLSSRFEAGLVVDIAPPELETRMAIIRSKAETQHLQIPNEVVLYVARLIRSNIRAIEGALLKLHAYASVMNTPVSAELAADVLERYFEQPKESLITPETIQSLVARHFDVSVENLNSASREAAIVRARQIAMYLIRQLTHSSLPTIGRTFGGKDHSTVLYAVNKISKLVMQDAAIADDVAALTRELKDSGF